LDLCGESAQRLGIEPAAGAVELDVEDRERLAERVRGDGGRLVVHDRLELRVLEQDRALEPLERRARVDAELVAQVAARRLVGSERLRLPSGPVEGEHLLETQGLAE